MAKKPTNEELFQEALLRLQEQEQEEALERKRSSEDIRERNRFEWEEVALPDDAPIKW